MPYNIAPKIDSNNYSKLAGRHMTKHGGGGQRYIREALAAARDTFENLDSFKSNVTGMNVAGRDKKKGYRFTVDGEEYADRDEIEAMYLESGITATVVDKVAADYYRKGYHFKTGDDNAELAEEVAEDWKRLKVFERFQEATIDDRLYGGGGAFLGIDDGNLDNPEIPVEEDSIKSINFINILDKYELRVVDWYNDPNHAEFGKPSMYEVIAHRTRGFGLTRQHTTKVSSMRSYQRNFTILMRVHATRILRFVSNPLPYHMDAVYALETSPGWGVGVVQRARRAIMNLENVFDSLATIVQEYVQAGFAVQGYAELVATEEGRELVRERMKVLQYVRSIVNAWVHDTNESLELQTVDTRGLSDIIEKIALQLTAITQIPLTKLLGQSPSGMNATGDADTQGYFEFLAMGQSSVIIPNLRQLTHYLLLAKEGFNKGKEIEKWEVYANPLHDVSDQELATLKKTYAEIDAMYLDRGVYDTEECADSRFGPSDFGAEIQLDSEKRKGKGTKDFSDEDERAALEKAEKGELPTIPGAKAAPPTAKPTNVEIESEQGDATINADLEKPADSSEGALGVGSSGDAQSVALNGAQSLALQSGIDKVVAGEWSSSMGVGFAKITIPTVDIGTVTTLMDEAEAQFTLVSTRKEAASALAFERAQKNKTIESQNPDQTL